jgi:putative SOS response-associated peptidase YedK
MIIIGQVSGMPVLEAHFEISFGKGQAIEKQYRIHPKEEVLVITTQDPHTFTTVTYGMVPFWSGEKIVHFEAPVDGGEKNEEPLYKIKKRIILHPSYRRPIRETRCLIPSDYFMVQSSPGEVYLLFSMQNRPFALAGIYDNWKQSGHDKDIYQGFAILTLPSYGKLKELGIERIPLIINPNKYKKWLKKESVLTEITSLMNLPGLKDLNGYPINKKMFQNNSKEREIVRPAGNLIFPAENQNMGKQTEYLRSFRYQRGLTHHKGGQEERIWRKDGI